MDQQVLEYVARHIHDAVKQKQFDYLSKNTIRIRMFDPSNMPEGMHLVVEVKIGEEGVA